jgi:aspartate carbamoyltransferase regulatory subunit
MNKDAIDMAKFGMGLVFFALLLYYTIDSVNMGKNVGADTLSGFEQVQIAAEKSTLEDLNNLDTVMPAATAFSLLEYNIKNIRQVTCYLCDSTNGEVRAMNEDLCIVAHLKGTVVVSVRYKDSFGLYDVTFRKN